jgi:hypothetical protein
MDKDAPPSDGDSGTFEKWLVRTFLILAFGVAFGIEGMTLIRGYLIDDGDESARVEQSPEEQGPTLQSGEPFFAERAFTAHVERLAMLAESDAWRFVMDVRVQNPTGGPLTLTFDRLETKNGRTLSSPVSHTWAPGDSSAFTAEWTLAPGDQPEAVTVTPNADTSSPSASAGVRFRIGRVPVQMQR